MTMYVAPVRSESAHEAYQRVSLKRSVPHFSRVPVPKRHSFAANALLLAPKISKQLPLLRLSQANDVLRQWRMFSSSATASTRGNPFRTSLAMFAEPLPAQMSPDTAVHRWVLDAF